MSKNLRLFSYYSPNWNHCSVSVHFLIEQRKFHVVPRIVRYNNVPSYDILNGTVIDENHTTIANLENNSFQCNLDSSGNIRVIIDCAAVVNTVRPLIGGSTLV